ncbi:MAG: biopolymer transporter ExbD [Bacteroidia bacterium]|nr:biopolymer transporter ExbD [Bacteroidia bacterium]
MSDVQTGDDGGGGGGKHQKRRAKKSSTRIDMTPMVDLGFLLLTFFVLTATFSKPTTMEITMPIKDKDDTAHIKVKNVITIMLADNDRMFYYEGVLNPDGSTPVVETSFDQTKGIRKVLFEKQKGIIDLFREIEKEVKAMKGKISDDSIQKLYDFRKNEIHKAKSGDEKLKGNQATLTVIIKPDPKASYKNVIDMVDEMSIAQIGKYAIVDISDSEKDVLTKLGVK